MIIFTLLDHSDSSSDGPELSLKSQVGLHGAGGIDLSSTHPEDTEGDTSEDSPRTVRKNQDIREGAKLVDSSNGGNALQWDYSFTTESGTGTEAAKGNALGPPEEISLALIYQTIMTHREGTRTECKAHVVNFRTRCTVSPRPARNLQLDSTKLKHGSLL